MGSNSIAHIGRVVALSDKFIEVSIMSDSACSGCHAKGKCGLAESKEKIVTVARTAKHNVQIGDEVEVVISVRGGIFAVVMAYIIPVVIVVLSLYLGEVVGLSEIVSFVIMLLSVAIYYTALYYTRKRFDKKMKIEIK